MQEVHIFLWGGGHGEAGWSVHACTTLLAV